MSREEKESSRGVAAPLLTHSQARGLAWLYRSLATAREAKDAAPATVAGTGRGGHWPPQKRGGGEGREGKERKERRRKGRRRGKEKRKEEEKEKRRRRRLAGGAVEAPVVVVLAGS